MIDNENHSKRITFKIFKFNVFVHIIIDTITFITKLSYLL